MMDSSFIEAIQEGNATKVLGINGQEYATKAVHNPPLPEEPQPTAVVLTTLTGLVDYIKGAVDEERSDGFLHVESPIRVSLRGKLEGVRRNRDTYLVADLSKTLMQFPFGEYMPHGEFMTKLQSMFLDYGDRAKVMKIIGTIRVEKAKTSMDDGITQRVVAAQGITLNQEVAVPNPVMLRPYRTFTEIEQPPSNFVLRVSIDKKDKDGMPDIALFEADGGHWKREAMQSIREYLQTACGTDQVVLA